MSAPAIAIAVVTASGLTVITGCTAEVSSPNGGSPGMPGLPGSNGGTGGSLGAGPQDCSTPQPPSAPLRRLTHFEYDNTVRDLAGFTQAPASGFPPEESGNGFGNDARAQSVSATLAERYMTTARDIAAALTAPDRIASLVPCAAAPEAAAETTCARSVVDAFVPKAYRRALKAGEGEGYVQLFQTLRGAGESFASSVAGMLESALQGPELLYRPELGVPVEGRPDLLRPSAEEMATRLSYLFWGSMPDDALRAAAAGGELETPGGIRNQAARLLADPRAKQVVRYFFDNLLPIQGLAGLERDAQQFPAFNASLGALMRQETEAFLENEIFGGPGTWPGVFTAPYTYVNEALARFYGIPGVTGDAFQKVSLDGTKRAGLLTQAGILSGPIHSNHTNPVTRGSFVVQKLLCQTIPLPTGEILAQVKPPEPYSAPTARERFTLHSTQPACQGCHVNMDPVGFALENFNAVGQWRDQENGVTIDASGTSPLLGTFNGAVELGKKVAESAEAQSCFAQHWVNFAYGRIVGERDTCSLKRAQNDFAAAGYKVQDLLLALTQTDNFLYLPGVRE